MSAPIEGPNAAQAEYWTNEGGPSWVRNEHRYEQMLQPFDDVLIETLAPAPQQRVLEIGCGFGATALSFAELGASVHGIDIAQPMIDRARERAAQAQTQTTFAVVDAQEDDLGGPFDCAVSRFGVMFFVDPVRAFANIAQAIVPGGRLAFVCWQRLDRNPWLEVPIEVVREITGEAIGPAKLAPGAPNPLAFADPLFTESVLEQSGWRDISLRSVEPLLRVGGDDGINGAVELALNGSSAKALLAKSDADQRAHIVSALTERLSHHVIDGDVCMSSAAWLVTARTSPDSIR